MSSSLVKPRLYRAEGTEAVPAHPALLGGRCGCGHVFFPWQRHGCERCGATDGLTPESLSGAGTLLARTEVHLHAGTTPAAPFWVGTIGLDDGPVIRSLLSFSAGQPPPAGARMHACLVDVVVPARDNMAALAAQDLRFGPARPAETTTC